MTVSKLLHCAWERAEKFQINYPASLKKQTKDKILSGMALHIDEIMELSLDDYIAISKSTANSVGRNKNHEFKESSTDNKFDRRKSNTDDEDEEEFVIRTPKEELGVDTQIGDPDTDIWKGPSSSTTYLDFHDTQNDLREKLNNNNKSCSSRESALQYRLKAPNNAPNRTRGIPTLLPLDFQMSNRNWSHKQGNRRYRRNRGCNTFQGGFNNLGNNQNNASMGGVNNGRVRKNRNQDFECKNLRFSLVGNNRNKNNISNCSNSRARNLIIETPSSSINLEPSPPLKSSFHLPMHTAPERFHNRGSQILPVGNLTPQAEAVLNLNSMASQSASNNESLKSLLGFQGNISGEMMPIFASRLMEYIQTGLQNPVVHKPIYDMKIQKDIHEIQKKPLLYKCPGGEVVSSDGAGVNCKIIPSTSGISLNCRFA